MRSLFKFSTIKDMADIIESQSYTLEPCSLAPCSEQEKLLPTHYLTEEQYRTILAAMAGVNAEPVRPGSLIMKANVMGTKKPLFWCGNDFTELLTFAKYLGPDQPLYMMFSGGWVSRETKLSFF